MSTKVVVAGVGMTPFVKPGENRPYTEMGADAIRALGAEGAVVYDLKYLLAPEEADLRL